MKVRFDASAEDHAAVADAWDLQLGRFMSTFAMLEDETYSFLSWVSSRRVMEALKGSNLDLRRKLIMVFAREKLQDQGLVERLDGVLRRIKTLSEPRNVVAHNGHVFQLQEDAEGLSFRPVISRGSHPERDVIDLSGLEALAVEAKSLLDDAWVVQTELRAAIQAQLAERDT